MGLIFRFWKQDLFLKSRAGLTFLIARIMNTDVCHHAHPQSWVRWDTFTMLALTGGEDQECKEILGYIVSSRALWGPNSGLCTHQTLCVGPAEWFGFKKLSYWGEIVNLC